MFAQRCTRSTEFDRNTNYSSLNQGHEHIAITCNWLNLLTCLIIKTQQVNNFANTAKHQASATQDIATAVWCLSCSFLFCEAYICVAGGGKQIVSCTFLLTQTPSGHIWVSELERADRHCLQGGQPLRTNPTLKRLSFSKPAFASRCSLAGSLPFRQSASLLSPTQRHSCSEKWLQRRSINQEEQLASQEGTATESNVLTGDTTDYNPRNLHRCNALEQKINNVDASKWTNHSCCDSSSLQWAVTFLERCTSDLRRGYAVSKI